MRSKSGRSSMVGLWFGPGVTRWSCEASVLKTTLELAAAIHTPCFGLSVNLGGCAIIFDADRLITLGRTDDDGTVRIEICSLSCDISGRTSLSKSNFKQSESSCSMSELKVMGKVGFPNFSSRRLQKCGINAICPHF